MRRPVSDQLLHVPDNVVLIPKRPRLGQAYRGASRAIQRKKFCDLQHRVVESSRYASAEAHPIRDPNHGDTLEQGAVLHSRVAGGISRK